MDSVALESNIKMEEINGIEALKNQLYNRAIDKMKQNKEITHPSHYCEGRKYEPKDVIRDWDLNFNLGNAVKYISRAGRKDPDKLIEDLRKAMQYIKYEIDYLYETGESK